MKEGVIPSYSETCPPFATEVPNTSVFVSPEIIQTNSRLITTTYDFIATNSQQAGECFSRNFTRYQRVERNIADSAILTFLERRKMHLPSFQIYDYEAGNQFLAERSQLEMEAFTKSISSLEEVRLNEKPLPCFDPNFPADTSISERSILVTYQYPKPISAFWHKSWLRLNEGESMSSEMHKAVKEIVKNTDHPGTKRAAQRIQKKFDPQSRIHTIEWGKFRMPLRHQLLETINRFSQGRGLKITRLNRRNGHNAGEYDYLYQFSLPESA